MESISKNVTKEREFTFVLCANTKYGVYEGHFNSREDAIKYASVQNKRKNYMVDCRLIRFDENGRKVSESFVDNDVFGITKPTQALNHAIYEVKYSDDLPF